MTDRKRDLKVELTLLTSVPRSPSVLHTGEKSTPYSGLNREAPPEMISFFSVKVQKGGSLLVYVMLSKAGVGGREEGKKGGGVG